MPPCTEAIIAAGIKHVVAGATDPNPHHAGKGFEILRRAGIRVDTISEHAGDGALQRLAGECTRLNEVFNHWILRRRPFVTVKAAMTLDGKIATAHGESKWITGEEARAAGMKLRHGSDAILVGVNTILADDPSLTVRQNENTQHSASNLPPPRLRRIVLDSLARTPLTARVVSDEFAALTTIVVGKQAPKNRVLALVKKVTVLTAPLAKSATGNAKPGFGRQPAIDLRWLVKKLGAAGVTSLLVEGGGEVNASFLLGGLAQRVAFFYAPKILGGREARPAVAGGGATSLRTLIQLRDTEWRQVGDDLLLTALIA
jgi:diaminohydroxyphosphoribosylaminopyrimidine deaminase/5-amino-6-(5-phosphoribosylamino)uracil reductase